MSPLKGSAAAAIVATAFAVPFAASASASAASGQSVAVGKFNRSLVGASVFRQTGTTVSVNGLYGRLPGRLPANRSFFTVAYANRQCDPAQAFPVGPFTTNRYGVGSLSTTVSGMAGLVAGTRSVSVRRGDDATDIDQDGLIGPTDVVAVPGQPGIGLIECDANPLRTG